MIRVLHVIGKMDIGGAETFIMNVYRKMDRNQIQFDFMVHSNEPGVFDDEIRKLGGHIYTIQAFKGINTLSYSKAWDVFFKEHTEYKAVHGHIGSSASIYLKSAKKHGIYAIAHSHCTYTFNKISFLHKLLTFTNRFFANYYFACSYEAGITRYGKKIVNNHEKFSIVKNGIDSKKYAFNKEVRNNIRAELGIDNYIVIGMVGRLTSDKNPDFIIKIIQSFLENDNVKFLWIGDGELKEHIVSELNIRNSIDKVHMLGAVLNVHEYLQAMDVFVFPSVSEGLGIALIEAQASGLPCVISTGIPNEAIVTNLCKKMDIKKNVSEWKKEIEKQFKIPRENTIENISKSGYDINSTVEYLEKFYLDI